MKRLARGLAFSCCLGVAASEAPRKAAESVDDRTRELVRRDCSTGLGRNEVTLFANGTIRMREWAGEEMELRLAELGRDEVDAYIRRFQAVDFTESQNRPSGVTGEWIERCDLRLALVGEKERTFRYGRLDTLDLAFASLLRIVDELAATVADRAAAGELPADYAPRQGDLLARPDGVEFEVMGFTADGNGVELRGRLDPLTFYIPRSDLPKHFNRLVRRAP